MGDNREEIHTMKQGSESWYKIRCGKITGSRFKDILSTRGAARGNYMRELLLERKTGRPAESYVSPEMEWGIQTEPQARAYYEKITGEKVEQVGFIDHPGEPYKGYVGVSPDGLVGNDGCIEIKCPNTATHLGYLSKGVVPTAYIPQVQGLLWVTGRIWCDFISFDPRVPEAPYFCKCIQRDDAYIDKLAAAVDVFIQEMVEMQKNEKGVDPQLLIDVTQGGCTEKEWDLKRANEIRGKCLFGYQTAMLTKGWLPKELLEPQTKAEMLELFNFAMTGK